MITHITYEEASFRNLAAAERAIAIAAESGWTRSDLRARGGKVTVLFRHDTPVDGDRLAPWPSLPVFEHASSGGVLSKFSSGWKRLAGRAPRRRRDVSPLGSLSERPLRHSITLPLRRSMPDGRGKSQ